MQVSINKVVNCGSDVDYYRNFFEVINTLIDVSLVPREIDVLSLALCNRVKTQCFSKHSRKLIRKKLGISYSQLSNLIGSLKQKGLLYEDSIGEIKINSNYIPSNNKQIIQIALVNNG